MGKNSWRSFMRHKKDRSGCLRGLISIFDFQNDHSTQKLLSVSTCDDIDDAGNSRNRTDLLVDSDERFQVSNDNEGARTGTASADKPPSVKKLMQQEINGEQDLKKQMNNPMLEARDSSSKCGAHLKSNKNKSKKVLKKFCNDQIDEKEFTCYADANSVIDELCSQILEGKIGDMEHEQHDEVPVLSRQQSSVSEENLIEATEVIVGKHLAEDKDCARNKDFLNALKILNLNKELLLKLLHDPNSLLMKRVKGLLDSQMEKVESVKSLEKYSNLWPLKFASHDFFRKRIKSHFRNPPPQCSSALDSNRIVILKPLQDSEYETEGPIVSTTPQLSFTGIIRWFLRFVGKDQHGVCSDNCKLRDREEGIGGEVYGRNSSSRDHFFNEIFPKVSIGVKNGNHIAMSRHCSELLTPGNSEHQASNIYIEAKKHISELLGDGDKNEESLSRPDSESLGHILSLAGREKMKLSINDERVDENVWFQQATESCWDLPSFSDDKPHEKIIYSSTDDVIRGNEVEQTFIAVENDMHSKVNVAIVEQSRSLQQGCQLLDAYSEPSDSCSDVFIPDNEADRCSDCNEICHDVDAGIDETSKSTIQDHKIVWDASCELSTKNEQNHNVDTICDEESSFKSPKLDLKEVCETPFLPPASPSGSFTMKESEHLEGINVRPERPSPLSVLDLLFSDDDVYLTRSIDELPIQSLETQFKDCDSSEKDQENHLETLLVHKGTIFEYIKAAPLASSLGWDDMVMSMLSLEEKLLQLSLLKELGLFPDQRCHDQKLLIDCVNEVLVEVLKSYFSCLHHLSTVKCIIQPVPDADAIINKVLEGIEWHLQSVHPPFLMDKILRKDMARSGAWMNYRADTESFGIEVGEALMGELIEETIWSCLSGMQSGFPAVMVE